MPSLTGSPRFQYHTTPCAVCVFDLGGDLDPEAADALLAEVTRQFDAGHRRFVFDLAKLKYVGSLGLRVFVGLAGRVKADAGAVCLCSPTPNVRTAFEVTKLTKLLRFYPTRDDALDAARR